jgi:peptide chain release factor 2
LRKRKPRAAPSLIRSWYKLFVAPVLDLTDFKRDLSELTDRLGHAQDCL